GPEENIGIVRFFYLVRPSVTARIEQYMLLTDKLFQVVEIIGRFFLIVEDKQVGKIVVFKAFRNNERQRRAYETIDIYSLWRLGFDNSIPQFSDMRRLFWSPCPDGRREYSWRGMGLAHCIKILSKGNKI